MSGFSIVTYVTLAPELLSLRVSTLLRLLILLVLVLSPVLKSYGQKTVDIYGVDVLVVNQSAEVRRKAASDAFKKVLVRLSGDADIAKSYSLKAAISNASDYLDRYSYQSTNETIKIAGAEQSATLLLMQFNGNALKRLLKQSGLKIWSESRPDVLVWVATDRRGKKYVDNDSAMARSLNSAAEDRALPIVYPVLDLEDRSALPIARLWALDEDRIKSAAKRYETNAVLSGRFSLSSKKWSGSFILVHQGKTRYFNAESKSRWAVARSIINQLTDYFADIYAVNFDTKPTVIPTPIKPVPTSPNSAVDEFGVPLPTTDADSSLPIVYDPRTLFIQVKDIDKLKQYTVLMAYLEALSLVDSVQIASVKNSNLLLKIKLLTDKDKFYSTIDLDRRLLRSADSGLVDPGGREMFEFIWR